MPVTGVRGRQILDDSVTRADINVTASGSALITKVLVGAGLVVQSSTGVDSGTGDVTLALGNSGVTAGTYGSSTLVPVITVDQYGRITGVTTQSISSGTGTVTSVGLAMPAIFTVTNSPVTTSGTLTATLANQNANVVFAGPATGVAAAPTFRGLAAADIPSLDTNKLTSGTLPVARGGTGATAFSAGAILYAISATQFGGTLGTAGQFLVSGGSGAPTWVNASLSSITDSYIKRSVRVATTGQVPLSGLATVDGVTLVAGDRVLVKNNDVANPAFHGIYIANSGTWTRATDNDSLSEMVGAVVFVEQGTVNGGTLWRTNFRTTDTFGTTAISWFRVVDTNFTIPVSQGGTGLTALGTANQLLRVNAGGTALEYFTPTFLTANQTITVSGDATGSGTTAIALTLANSGVTAGTYRSVTVNAKGLVTGGTNPTTLAGYGITDALPLTGGTLSGTLIFANATSPNTHTIQFGDNTGWVLRMMTNVSGTPTQRFAFGDNGTFSAVGQIISTKANTTATGTGQIYLNGTGGNRIEWNAQGVAAPSYTTRSVGTKLVLYPSVTASQVDYALGIESDTLWSSVAVIGGSFKWYGGTQLNMHLSGQNLVIGTGAGVGAGRLTVNALSGGTSLYITDAVNSTLYITHPSAGVTRFFNGSATQWLQETGGSVTVGASTSAPSKLFLFNTNDSIPDYQITHQSAATSMNTSSPIIITNLYNSGANGHNLYITSNAATGIWEYNITKTWGGILSFGSSNAGTTIKRDLYIYDSGQLRFANYTTTTSFTGTAVGVLAFTSDGSIIPIPTPGGGSGLTGSGTTNYIPKFTAGTSVGNSQIFDNGTNVGIGTIGPNQKFEVRGDTVRIRMASVTAPTVYYFDLESRYDAADTINMYGAGGVNFLKWISNTGAISLNPNGSNVGINTTTPDAPLRVAGAFNGTHSIFGQVNGRGLAIQTLLVAGTNDAGSILNARGAGSGTLIIQTDGTERVRVASNGDTGIGTDTIANTANYTTLQVNGTAGGIVRFSYGGTNAGTIYGSSAETGINAPAQINMYVANVQIANAQAGQFNTYETFYARKLGAQIQLAGGVGTASGLFQAGNNIVFLSDWATGTNGITVDVSNGILRTRGSAAGGAYIQFERSGTTTYGYVGNASGLIGTAGFNANTDLAIRSEGNINFATSSTAIAQLNTNGRLTLRTYTTTTSHTGTAVGVLAFDSSGNIITIATPGGGGSSQWTTSGSNIYYSAGNVGIGSTNSRLRTEINAAASDWTVLSNDVSNGHLLLSHSGGNVMAVGLNTNKAWLQVRDYLGVGGNTYDFYLNPLGGRLIVNSQTSDGVGTLQLNGTLSFRTSVASTIPAIRFLPKTSLITSTSQGDMETDTNGLLYYSYAATDRGVMGTSHYMALNNTYTLTSSTTAQRIFNTGTNGAIAVEALAYEFEMRLYVTNMSTGSNHALTIGFGVANGASINSIGYTAVAGKGTVTTPGTAQSTVVATANATAITSSNTGSAAYALVKGIVRFSAGGTFIPRITLGVASSAVVQTNSYFKLTPFGGSNATSVGNVS